MNPPYIKIIRKVFNIILIILLVLVLEHSFIFLYNYKKLTGPIDNGTIDTLDNFVFLVSPLDGRDIVDLPNGQLLIAKIKNKDLLGQTQEDVLMNKKGPVSIVGKYVCTDSENYFEEVSTESDLSLFKIQKIDEIKVALNNKGYIVGGELFPLLDKPLPEVSFSVPPIPISICGNNFATHFLLYNDRYIRICSYSFGNKYQYDYDHIYCVDDDRNFKIVRKICKTYRFD